MAKPSDMVWMHRAIRCGPDRLEDGEVMLSATFNGVSSEGGGQWEYVGYVPYPKWGHRHQGGYLVFRRRVTEEEFLKERDQIDKQLDKRIQKLIEEEKNANEVRRESLRPNPLSGEAGVYRGRVFSSRAIEGEDTQRRIEEERRARDEKMRDLMKLRRLQGDVLPWGDERDQLDEQLRKSIKKAKERDDE